MIILSVLAVTGAGAAVTTRDDPTYLSIWVGVTSTAFAAALVDASAVLEARRRTASIERVVHRRLRQARQVVLSQIRVVFAALPTTSEVRLAQSLRALPDTPIDLRTAPADVYPERTRQTYLRELQGQLQALLDELSSFLAAGVLTDELEAVDRLLRGHPFMILIRDVLVSDIWLKTSTVPAEQAAELLDQLESVLRTRLDDGA